MTSTIIMPTSAETTELMAVGLIYNPLLQLFICPTCQCGIRQPTNHLYKNPHKLGKAKIDKLSHLWDRLPRYLNAKGEIEFMPLLVEEGFQYPKPVPGMLPYLSSPAELH